MILDNSYKLILSAGEHAVQVTSQEPVEFVYSGSLPADDVKGFVVKQYDGVSSNVFGVVNNLYGRAFNDGEQATVEISTW